MKSHRISLHEFVGHATTFCYMRKPTRPTACCLVVRLALELHLVSGWLVVMYTYLYSFRCHCLCPSMPRRRQRFKQL